MSAKRFLPRLLLAILMVACLMTQALPASASSHAALALAPGCAYGYSFQSITHEWLDLHSQPGVTKLAFSASDDAVAHVSNIGFSFPFFENSYTEAYVSTNGFISFGTQNENAFSKNFSIPAEFPPNNMIAGFWDDLTVGGNNKDGAVYFKVTGTAPNRTAVFEWYLVTRLKSTETVSFQIVLTEKGDILFRYGALSGELNLATVGIEDGDGVDGCQLLYNAAGLASNQSYKLTNPGGGQRVKAKPVYQGKFLVNGSVDLPITLVNTGTSSDSYQFQKTILDGSFDWKIDVVDAQGKILTVTPVIPAKQTYPAFIRVQSVETSTIGSYIKGELTIISKANSQKKFVINFDASIPAPFAAFYIDSSAALIRYSMPERQITTRVFPYFTGSTFSLARVTGSNYFLTWEYIRRGSVTDYENIQKNVMGPTTGQMSPISNLVDHADDLSSTFDANPVMAVSSDNTIGVVFVRSIADENYDMNTNVYFARLDYYGKLLSPVINLTQNNTYQSNLLYSLPVITATSDHRFVIAYEAATPYGGSSVAKDIDIAVVSSQGQILSAPHHITDSQISGTEFYAPTITHMKNGDAFIGFLSHESGMPVSQIIYTVYHPDTDAVDLPTALVDVYGEGPQAGTLLDGINDGNIILAWVNDGSLSVGYIMFDPQAARVNPQPLELASANGWRIENISLTGEVNGNGVITWKDEWGYFLYYALVTPGGDLYTPPMAFLRGSNPNSPNLINSSTGKGIAPLDNEIFWYTFMPAIVR